jgi:phosphoglycolate phosphatase
MRTHITTVIWDWNGTLFDDAWLCLEIINSILSKRNLPALSANSYQTVFDFPVADYYKKLGFDFDNEPYEIVAEEFINAYEARRTECALIKNSREILTDLKLKGITQHILSAYSQNTLNSIILHYSIREFFDSISGLDNPYAASKVAIGKNLMKTLAVAPKEILMIGDTTHDFSVASAMGISCILIPGGHQSKQRLLATGAHVLDSIRQIHEHLSDS